MMLSLTADSETGKTLPEPSAAHPLASICSSLPPDNLGMLRKNISDLICRSHMSLVNVLSEIKAPKCEIKTLHPEITQFLAV
jgi:hypothetical protein